MEILIRQTHQYPNVKLNFIQKVQTSHIPRIGEGVISLVTSAFFDDCRVEDVYHDYGNSYENKNEINVILDNRSKDECINGTWFKSKGFHTLSHVSYETDDVEYGLLITNPKILIDGEGNMDEETFDPRKFNAMFPRVQGTPSMNWSS